MKALLIVILIFLQYSLYSQSNEEENFFILRRVLSIEKEIFPEENVNSFIDTVVVWTNIIKEDLINANSIQDSIRVITDFLYNKRKFQFNLDCDYIKNIFNDNCGLCTTFSMLFLSITDELKMTGFYSIHLPEHILVQYNKNGTIINIELTNNGNLVDFNRNDKICINNNCYIVDSLLKWNYFKPMSRYQLISDAYNIRGSYYLNNNNLVNAINDFKSAIAGNSYNETAFYNIAKAYNQIGEVDKSIENNLKAILLNPDYAGAYGNLIKDYCDILLYSKAIEIANVAINRGLGDDNIYNNRGWANFNLLRDSQALDDFNKSISYNPEKIAAYRNKVKTKLMMRDYNNICFDLIMIKTLENFIESDIDSLLKEFCKK